MCTKAVRPGEAVAGIPSQSPDRLVVDDIVDCRRKTKLKRASDYLDVACLTSVSDGSEVIIRGSSEEISLEGGDEGPACS